MTTFLTDDEFLNEQPTQAKAPKRLLTDDEFLNEKPGPDMVDQAASGTVDKILAASGNFVRGAGEFLQAPVENLRAGSASVSAALARASSPGVQLNLAPTDALGNVIGPAPDAAPEKALTDEQFLGEKIQDARQASDVAMRAREKARQDGTLLGTVGGTLEDTGRAAQQTYGAMAGREAPAMLAQQQEINDADGFWGTMRAAATRPLGVLGTVADSAPDMAVGMGLGSAAAKGVSMAMRGAAEAAGTKAFQEVLLQAASNPSTLANATKLAAAARDQAYRSTIEHAAERAGGTVGLVSEGASSGMSTRAQVQNLLEQRDGAGTYQFSDDDLAKNSPRFVALLKQGNDPATARSMLASELSDQAAPLAALWTIGAGKLSGAAGAEGKVLAGSRISGVTALRGVGKEVLEEAMQNPGEDYAGYDAKRQFDPSQKFDLGGSIAQGVIGGLGQGGPMHAAGYLNSQAAPAESVRLAGRPIDAFSTAQLTGYAKAGVLTGDVKAKVDAELKRRAEFTAALDSSAEALRLATIPPDEVHDAGIRQFASGAGIDSAESDVPPTDKGEETRAANSAPATTVDEVGTEAQTAEPAQQALSDAPSTPTPAAFSFTLRPDGTLSIAGDSAEIRAAFPGVPAMPTANGVLIGRSQARAVLQTLQERADAPGVADVPEKAAEPVSAPSAPPGAPSPSVANPEQATEAVSPAPIADTSPKSGATSAGLDGFGAGRSPVARELAAATLAKSQLFDGEAMTRQQAIQQRVATSATIVSDASGRRLVQPDGSSLTERAITKTGIDYAQHLIDRRKAAATSAEGQPAHSAAPGPTPAEVAPVLAKPEAAQDTSGNLTSSQSTSIDGAKAADGPAVGTSLGPNVGNSFKHAGADWSIVKISPSGKSITAQAGDGAVRVISTSSPTWKRIAATAAPKGGGTAIDATVSVEPAAAAQAAAGAEPSDSTATTEAGIVQDRTRVAGQIPFRSYERSEVPRVQAAKALQRLIDAREAGKITAAGFDMQLQFQVDRLAQIAEIKSTNRLFAERQRGADIVREKLIRAKRMGDIDPATAEFGLWALDRNPQLAEGLGISVRSPRERGAAGQYSPAASVMTIFKGSANDGTAVHEVLHHSERMMPGPVQAGIRKEWARAYAAAMKEAIAFPKRLDALHAMAEAMAGSRAAQQRVADAFSNGTLDYSKDYPLTNPSEFWAVKATDILSKRYAAGTWQATAAQWLREMVEKVRGLIGLRSDAPLLRALDAVLAGDGSQQAPKMLSDAAHYGAPAERSSQPPSEEVSRVEGITAGVHPRQADDQSASSTPRAPYTSGAAASRVRNSRATGGSLPAKPAAATPAPAPRPPAPPATPPVARPAAVVPAKPDVPAETRMHAFQRRVQDQYNRMQVLRKWAIGHGAKFTPASDVYTTEERMAGRAASRIEDFRTKTVQPLVEAAQKAGFTMDQVAEILHAGHAEERNKQIAKINPAMPDGGSGMSTADAQAKLAAAPAALKALATRFQMITDSSRDVLLNAGIISQDMVNAWASAYKNYVPLKGGDEEAAATGTGVGKGLSVNGKSKRAMGHGERDEAIIENILRDHERAIMLAEKNRVAQSMMLWASELADDRIVTIDKPIKRAVLMPKYEYDVRGHMNLSVQTFDTEAQARNFIVQQMAVKSPGASTLRIVKSVADQNVQYMAHPMLQENEARVYVNGHAIRMQFNDPVLASVYKRLGTEQLSKIMAMSREVNTFLSKAYTGYNPAFILRNMVRDFGSGMINITGNFGVGIAAKSMANYPKALATLIRYSYSGRTTPDIDAYRAHGGSTGGAYLGDLERIGTNIQKDYEAYQGVMAQLKQKKPGAAARVAARKTIGGMIGWIEHINSATENAMRLAVFQAVRDDTGSVEKAASAAKNSTVNFNRKGELGGIMGSLYLFFNPNVQGTASIVNALTKGKNKHQAQALLSTMVGMGYAMAALQFGGDDEDYEAWRKIPDSVRDKNFILRTGKETYVTIPIPYGYGWFHTLGLSLFSLQKGESLNGISINMAANFMEHFSPVGNPLQGAKGWDKVDPRGLAELTPGAMFGDLTRDAVRLAVNRSSFGSEIVPDSKFDEDRPDFLRLFRGSKGTPYDAVARGLSDLTGGTPTQGGLVDLSPETLKFWVSAATGGTGTFLSDMLHLGGLGVRALTNPSDPDRGALTPEKRELPIARDYVKTETVQDGRRAFWDASAEAQAALKEFRRATKAGDEVGAARTEHAKAETMALARMAAGYGKMIKALRDDADVINADKTTTLAYKRAAIKQIERKEEEVYDDYLHEFTLAEKATHARRSSAR